MLVTGIVLGSVLLLVLALWKGPLAGLRRRGFAALYDVVQRRYEEHMVARRRALLSGLESPILEIGPGTGANLGLLPDGASWTGLEPNSWMRDRLRRRAEALGLPVGFVESRDGRIGAPDGSYATVLSTLVLCSVPDVESVLGEVRRVLRPSGRFVFLEHTAAPAGTGLRRVQRIIRPLWVFFADGCRPDRELEQAIREAGFAEVSLERFRVPKPVAPSFVSPHISGTAVNPS
jgi:ubiquinone/menaquinone biosynthesis C-methylase UbiE